MIIKFFTSLIGKNNKKTMPNLVSGFTLIELLVVIAIIGILSSVVLASLNTARNKGADAAVKANLANARAQAELFYDANSNSYDGGTAATDVCNTAALATGGIKGVFPNVVAAATATGITTPFAYTDTLQTATTAVCNSSATGWAASAPLKAGGFYCVDSTGASKTEVVANVLPAATVACI